MTKQLEFVFHGVDTTSGTYMAWESEDCPPAFVVLDRKELVRVTQTLRRSLPDYIDDEDITADKPERSLTTELRKSGGRNNTGRITENTALNLGWIPSFLSLLRIVRASGQSRVWEMSATFTLEGSSTPPAPILLMTFTRLS